MRSAMGSHVGSGTNWLSTSNTVEAGGVLDFSPPRSETPYAEMSRKQPAKSINIEMAAGSAPASRLVLDTGAGSSNFTTPYKGEELHCPDFITVPTSLVLPQVEEAHLAWDRTARTWAKSLGYLHLQSMIRGISRRLAKEKDSLPVEE